MKTRLQSSVIINVDIASVRHCLTRRRITFVADPQPTASNAAAHPPSFDAQDFLTFETLQRHPDLSLSPHFHDGFILPFACYLAAHLPSKSHYACIWDSPESLSVWKQDHAIV
jgi:hypothetical protein